MEQMHFPVTRRDAERSGVPYSSEANKNALFPSRLRELRKEKGVSQDVLSKVLGVSKSTVGLWETGDTLPDAKAIFDLANYFDVSADWILGRSDLKSTDIDVRKICDLLPLSELAVQTLLGMIGPDDLGGDPEILYVLNTLLEGLALKFNDGGRDTNGYALVDIAKYLNLQPLENGDIPEHFLNKVNLSEDEFLDRMNGALETFLLQEISNSLKYLRKRYYEADDSTQELSF